MSITCVLHNCFYIIRKSIFFLNIKWIRSFISSFYFPFWLSGKVIPCLAVCSFSAFSSVLISAWIPSCRLKPMSSFVLLTLGPVKHFCYRFEAVSLLLWIAQNEWTQSAGHFDILQSGLISCSSFQVTTFFTYVLWSVAIDTCTCPA